MRMAGGWRDGGSAGSPGVPDRVAGGRGGAAGAACWRRITATRRASGWISPQSLSEAFRRRFRYREGQVVVT